MKNNKTDKETDVLIIGAGIAGCIMALALCSRYSVTLIDKHASPQPKPGESLPPAVNRIFNKLKIGDILSQNKHLVCHGMTSSWASSSPITTDNLRNPDGMGWHVNRQQLEQDLRSVAKNRGVNLISPANVAQATFLDSPNEKQHWRIELASEQNSQQDQNCILKPAVVIDATGRHSAFIRQFVKTRQIKRQQFDKLMSVWVSYPSSNNQHLSTLVPTENGWWYSAPLPTQPFVTSESGNQKQPFATNHYRMLAWQTDADLMDKALTNKISGTNETPIINHLLAQAEQIPELQSELSNMDTHHIRHHGKVAANSSRLAHASGRQWFAIGDAAMSFDPLSSQGMFNGMATAMQLADLLNPISLTSAEQLQRAALTYQRQLDSIWQHYLHHRDYYYDQETRWKNTEFWLRRG